MARTVKQIRVETDEKIRLENLRHKNTMEQLQVEKEIARLELEKEQAKLLSQKEGLKTWDKSIEEAHVLQEVMLVAREIARTSPDTTSTERLAAAREVGRGIADVVAGRIEKSEDEER